MESHTARAVHRHKVVQLFAGDNKMQHYCWWGIQEINYRRCNHVRDVYGPAAMSPYSKHAPCHRMKQLWDADECHPHWSPAQCLCVTSLPCCNYSPSHRGIPGYQQNCKPWPKGCPKRLKRGSRVPQALEKVSEIFSRVKTHLMSVQTK